MTTMYFKSADPAKLAALDAHHAAKAALRKQCEEFAQQFADAGQQVAVFMRSSGGFGGVRFTPSKPDASWTVPADEDVQSPRAALKGKGFSKEEKAAQIDLRKRWDEARPKESVRREDLFRALTGVDYNYFSGFGVMVFDGFLYIESSQDIPADAGFQEILGSEYAAAWKAEYKARQAKQQAEREAQAKQGGWE